jgi:hypothetical protein
MYSNVSTARWMLGLLQLLRHEFATQSATVSYLYAPQCRSQMTSAVRRNVKVM